MRKRELLGMIFLIIGAGGVYLSVQKSPPQYIYLTANRDISPGEVVSTGDFAPQSFFLSTSGDRYVSGKSDLGGHRAIRTIARGEIIPRSAITSEKKIEERRLLTFVVAKSNAPKALQSGDLIDIFFFTPANSLDPGEVVELSSVIEKITVKEIDQDDVQLEGKLTISAFFDMARTPEIMTLIARSNISIAQRFDENE